LDTSGTANFIIFSFFDVILLRENGIYSGHCREWRVFVFGDDLSPVYQIYNGS
jgi:hypothetical protein